MSNSWQPNLSETSLVSSIIGLSDERSLAISEWIGELESSRSKPRGLALASLLGEALESYVGVEKGILAEAFLRTVDNRPGSSLE
jgi:hypothetical protein